MAASSRQQCRLIRGATVVSIQVREAARYMLSELDAMKMEVCKVRGRDGDGYIRILVSPNPGWYSRLCQQYLAQRRNRKWKRPRTQIRRSNVRRTLVALSQGWRKPGLEFDRVLAILEWWRAQNDFEGEI